MSAALIAYLRSCGARRIVYVSCNVTTQSRDLQRLCSGNAGQQQQQQLLFSKGGKGNRIPAAGRSSRSDSGLPAPFRVLSVQACDMFPHTSHVETVAILEAC